jgi:sugar diacid utilization regulator
VTTSSAVSEALDRLGREAATEHGCDPGLLQGYLPALLATASTLRRLTEVEKEACQRSGGEAAQAGLALPALVDLYMTASRRLWPQLSDLVGALRGRPVRPAELIRLGEAVWRAADDALAALAAGYVDAQRLVLRAEEGARLRFVEDLLNGHADIGSLVDRADTYGLNLSAGHVVAVAQAKQPAAPAGRLTTWVEQAVRSRFPNRGVLVTEEAGRLVCALSTPALGRVGQDTDAGVLGELAASAAAELTRRAGWRVAVSRRHVGPLGIRRCYGEALDALSVADRLSLPDRVVHARQLLVYRVLLRDESAMTDLVQAVLGPLAATAEGPDRLLRTLEAYFAEGGNTTAAARKLHLSVRALSYRLQRVHELTGYRAGDPAQQLTLSVAVTGARLLGWPQPAATSD